MGFFDRTARFGNPDVAQASRALRTPDDDSASLDTVPRGVRSVDPEFWKQFEKKKPGEKIQPPADPKAPFGSQQGDDKVLTQYRAWREQQIREQDERNRIAREQERERARGTGVTTRIPLPGETMPSDANRTNRQATETNIDQQRQREQSAETQRRADAALIDPEYRRQQRELLNTVPPAARQPVFTNVESPVSQFGTFMTDEDRAQQRSQRFGVLGSIANTSPELATALNETTNAFGVRQYLFNTPEEWDQLRAAIRPTSQVGQNVADLTGMLGKSMLEFGGTRLGLQATGLLGDVGSIAQGARVFGAQSAASEALALNAGDTDWQHYLTDIAVNAGVGMVEGPVANMLTKGGTALQAGARGVGRFQEMGAEFLTEAGQNIITNPTINQGELLVQSLGAAGGAGLVPGGHSEAQPSLATATLSDFAAPAGTAVAPQAAPTTAKPRSDVRVVGGVDAPTGETPSMRPANRKPALTPREGVDLDHLTPVARKNLGVVDGIASELGISTEITSGKRDRKESSHHNTGSAVDLSVKGLSQSEINALVAQVNAAGAGTAVFERDGQRNANGSTAHGDHIHITLKGNATPTADARTGAESVPEGVVDDIEMSVAADDAAAEAENSEALTADTAIEPTAEQLALVDETAPVEEEVMSEDLATTGSIPFEMNFPLSPEAEQGMREMLYNPDIALIAKNSGIRGVTIGRPYEFGLSQQGAIDVDGNVALNPNATNIQQTFLHEVGHQLWNNASDEQRDQIRGVLDRNMFVVNRSDEYKRQFESGELDEAMAELLGAYDELPSEDQEFFRTFKPEGRAEKATPPSPYDGMTADQVLARKQEAEQRIAALGRPSRYYPWGDFMAISDSFDLVGQVQQHGDWMTVVKDVNGGRHLMPASTLAKALQNPLFAGHVAEAWAVTKEKMEKMGGMAAPGYDFTINHLRNMEAGLKAADPIFLEGYNNPNYNAERAKIYEAHKERLLSEINSMKSRNQLLAEEAASAQEQLEAANAIPIDEAARQLDKQLDTEEQTVFDSKQAFSRAYPKKKGEKKAKPEPVAPENSDSTRFKQNDRVYMYPVVGTTPTGQPIHGPIVVGRIVDINGVHAVEVKEGKRTTYQPVNDQWVRGGDPHPAYNTQSTDSRGRTTLPQPELIRLARAIDDGVVKVQNLPAHLNGRVDVESGVITLNAKNAADPAGFARTLAHEIGHIIDKMGSAIKAATMNRGNLLGRLFVLEGVRAKMIADVKNADVKNELIALSEHWRPYDKANAPKAYRDYRESPAELYADGLSVLLNDPALAEQMAPTFTKTFFENLSEKPDVERAYNEVQALLNDPKALAESRSQDVKQGFAEAAQVKQQKFDERQTKKTDTWLQRLKRGHFEKHEALYRKVKQALKRGTYNGKSSPRYTIEEAAFDTEQKQFTQHMVENVDNVLHAAGVDDATFGEYLMYDRAINGYADKAKPGGHTVETARQGIEHLQRTLTAPQWDALQQAAKNFHEAVYAELEKGIELGWFTEDYAEAIRNNANNYATFRGVEYADTIASSTFHSATGSVGDIDNPYLATVQKILALQQALKMQRVAMSVRDFLKDQFADEIHEAEHTTDGAMLSPKDRGLDTMYVRENGEKKGYYIEKSIVEGLNAMMPKEAHWFIKSLGWMNNNVSRPAMITYNVVFAFYNNPLKDFWRTYKALGGQIGHFTFAKQLAGYIGNVMRAGRYAIGKQDAVLDEMIARRAIDYYQGGFWSGTKESPSIEFLRRHGLDTSKFGSFWNKLGRALEKHKALQVIALPITAPKKMIDLSMATLEALPKIAGYQLLKSNSNLSEREIASRVRNYIGTPNYREGGTSTRTSNTLFMFSNIFLRGMATDYDMAAGKLAGVRGASGFWFKTAVGGIMPAVLMAAAQQGWLTDVLGDDDDDEEQRTWLKRFYNLVPQYDKENYNVIPMHIVKNELGQDEAVYLRIPRTEIDRMVGGLVFRVLTGEKSLSLGTAMHLTDFGADQMPGLSPTLKAGGELLEFAANINPYDTHTQNNVIQDDVFLADKGQATIDMLERTASTLGWKGIWPANKVVKQSGKGQYEAEERAMSQSKIEQAKRRISDRKITDALRRGKKDIAEKIMADEQYSEEEKLDVYENAQVPEDIKRFKKLNAQQAIDSYRTMPPSKRERLRETFQHKIEASKDMDIMEKMRAAQEFGLHIKPPSARSRVRKAKRTAMLNSMGAERFAEYEQTQASRKKRR